MATVSHEQQLSPLQQKHRSQSDSNLLSPGEQNGNPDSVAVLRSGALGGSMGDLSPQKSGKKKGFLHKLVRPWKWKKKRRKGDKDSGHPSPGKMCYILHIILCV